MRGSGRRGRPEVIGRLDAAGLLPAITFIFSRAGCDAAVRQCLDAGLRLTTPDEASVITGIVGTADGGRSRSRTSRCSATASGSPALQRGIAAHHAGMLPTFKEVVEELFEARAGAGGVRDRDAGPRHQHACPHGASSSGSTSGTARRTRR